jgi:uncharacterized membrane protein
LFTIDSNFGASSDWPKEMLAWAQRRRYLFPGKTLILANLGGCVVPLAFSAHLFFTRDVSVWHCIAGITAVSCVAFALSRPVRGVGIGMPILFAPLTAAIFAYWLAGDEAAPLAYINGTLGVLIGADLLRFKDIRKMGAPVASIGGAGSFDGIFLSGLLAVLLA